MQAETGRPSISKQFYEWKTVMIKVENISKTYLSSDGPVEALEDVSFKIKEGEFVSFIGPSGCGKTTLLRIVAGLLAPTRGSVRVKDTEVTKPLTDIGFVFQKPVLLNWRTILGNIMLQAELRGLDKDGFLKRALELIDLTGLTEFRDKYPFELSGGMQQRVSVCRALVHDPTFLLMDEPFGALDEMTRQIMNLELQSIWMLKPKTVLFVTHSIAEAVFLADRVLVMSHRPGSVEADYKISLPRPRTVETLESQAFHDACRRIRCHFYQLWSTSKHWTLTEDSTLRK